MDALIKFKQTMLLIGDIFVLYAALVLMLFIRYGKFWYVQLFENHLEPFTIIFVIWIIIFYIASLYDFKTLKNGLAFEKTFWYAVLFNIALAALLFYLIPAFRITPRANLALFLVVFGTLGYAWRRSFNGIVTSTAPSSKLLIVGTNATTETLVAHIRNNPQLGYEATSWMQEGLTDKAFEHLAEIIVSNAIDTIVIPRHLKKDQAAAKLIYRTLALGIEVMEVSTLYEFIFGKVPLAELEETWFLEQLSKSHAIYEIARRLLELLIALLLLVITLPFALLIALTIKLTSSGPAIFSQQRVGKKEAQFTIYKFRTMYIDAEKSGPQWADYFKDKRATPIGRFLRRSHLDELPQLINIIRGELSFIGPRPERPEFVSELRTSIPYYDLRHLVKPGLTGWAQINFRYGATANDAYEKLQYDIYYIKNNSLLLDLLILIRTVKFLVTNYV